MKYLVSFFYASNHGQSGRTFKAVEVERERAISNLDDLVEVIRKVISDELGGLVDTEIEVTPVSFSRFDEEAH